MHHCERRCSKQRDNWPHRLNTDRQKTVHLPNATDLRLAPLYVNLNPPKLSPSSPLDSLLPSRRHNHLPPTRKLSLALPLSSRLILVVKIALECRLCCSLAALHITPCPTANRYQHTSTDIHNQNSNSTANSYHCKKSPDTVLNSGQDTAS